MKYLYAGVIVPASVIIPVVVGLVKTTYRQKSLNVMFAYLIFSGITDIAERLLGSRHINNLPLLHFYTIIEFLMVTVFFRSIFKGPLAGRVILWLMALFTLFAIADLVFIQSIYQYNSYPRPIAALIIIGLCLYYFFSYNQPDTETRWLSQPVNLLVTGLLVYFGSSLFGFAFFNVLYERASLSLYFIIGTIDATLVMIMYLLFTAGFIYAKNGR